MNSHTVEQYLSAIDALVKQMSESEAVDNYETVATYLNAIRRELGAFLLKESKASVYASHKKD